MTLTREIFEDICKYCEELREKEGYSAMLKIGFRAPLFKADSKAELILKINTRSVLAWDPSRDVTKKVITGLNEKYKK